MYVACTLAHIEYTVLGTGFFSRAHYYTLVLLGESVMSVDNKSGVLICEYIGGRPGGPPFLMAKAGYSLYPFDLGIASSLKVEIGGKDMGSVIELVRQRLAGARL